MRISFVLSISRSLYMRKWIIRYLIILPIVTVILIFTHDFIFADASDNSKELNPVRLCIPSVELSTKIVPVHVMPDGRLGVPKSSQVAGLFVDGVMPGQRGNALISGHVDNYKGPAVFYPLKKLQPGAYIFLFDEKNNYLMYEVMEVESYFTKDAPLQRIFGDTSEYRMNLITCTGKYNRNKKEHEQRLVVYTRLVQ